MEYTEGDWERQGNKVVVFGSGVIATCPSPTTDSGVLEFIANAQLIAQSPKMAGLLQRLVNDGWNAGISEEAREILSKTNRR